MDQLADAVDSLRFLVARPGTFTALYPETTDDMLLAVLIDGMAECQLEGLLLTYASDIDGLLTPALSNGQVAMVALFAAVRFIRAELLNRNTSVLYKGGTAEYQTSQSSNILRDILASLNAQKQRIIDTSGGAGGADSAFYMADQYLGNLWDGRFYGSGHASSYPGAVLSGW
jgi:hypothetical protein